MMRRLAEAGISFLTDNAVGFLVLVVLIAILSWAPVPWAESSEEVGSLVTASQAAALMRRAEEEDRLRVLVELKVPYRPEGGLNAYSKLQQRSQIARVQEATLSRLPAASKRVVRRFEHVPIMALEVDAQGLSELLKSPEVVAIEEDIPVPPSLSESVPLIGAGEAWLQGYDGTGWAVAVLDTGVAADHAAFAGKITGQACFSGAYDVSTSLCPNGEATQTGPGSGVNCPQGLPACDHGTHVAGIAVGAGSPPGVAKGADLVAIQVFSRFEGSTCSDLGISSPCVLTWTADQISALEWIYEQRAALNVAAVNMSLGSSSARSNPCDEDPRKPTIDTLRSVGIATVIAAGSGGATDGVSTPACISSAISVSASTDSDAVAAFSNVAEILDLFAPGAAIEAPVPTGYGTKGGTSMAAPHVSGAWAILKQRSPSATVSAVLSALAGTGVKIEDQRSGGYVSRPRIEVDEALAWFDPSPTSTVMPPSTATPTATVSPSPTTTATVTPTPSATATPTLTPSPAPSESSMVYLSEGYTGGGFDTYILLQNPNPSPADVSVRYVVEGEGVVERTHTVPGRSRHTIVTRDEAELGADAAFSTELEADAPLVVERSMYFANGGHSTISGAPPAKTWYFAEGYTGGGTGTYFMVHNPSSSTAELSVSYMLEDGGRIERGHSVPARSRLTIAAHDESQVGAGVAFSTQVQADVPVVVERSMYFASGGHSTVGVTEPERTWYFAEGYTGEGFETYLLVQNPNQAVAEFTVTYMLEGGVAIDTAHTVPAAGRLTIAAGDEAEVGSGAAFSTQVTSELPLVVERSMYFGNGGHSTIGVANPAGVWYLAEGYTGRGVATFILIQNPNPSTAEVTVSYMLEAGGLVERDYEVPPLSRYTIAAQDEAQVGAGVAFSAKVESDVPVVVERAMYFENGGHNTIAYAE